MTWVWIWLGVVAVTLLLEFVTMELVSVWFALGAFVALILASFGVPLEIQWIIFGIVSIISILSLRKVSLKLLQKNESSKVTSKELTVGKTFELLTDITENAPGTIKINGVEWNVVSKTETEIKAGERVEVVDLVGNKYVVKKTSKKPQKTEEN